MGVRGIFSTLRKNLSSVSTRREYDFDSAVAQCDRTSTDTLEETPTSASVEQDFIVVDGNAFVYWFVTFVLGREPSCLTDYSLLCRRLDEWLRKCHGLNLSFIFVFDGPTQPSKWTTKLKRMRKQAQDIVNSQVHKLQHGSPATAPSVASVPPVLGLQAVVQVLMRHEHEHEQARGGAVVRVLHAEGEADEQVVRVAVETGAVAILSNDSDMLFFHTRQAAAPSSSSSSSTTSSCVNPVTVPLLPFASCQLEKSGRRLVMEALIHRGAVARALGVRLEHLWLLAALLGHDSSDPETLSEIHRCLRDGMTSASSLSSRSFSSYSGHQSTLDDTDDDWLSDGNCPKTPKLTKKRNGKSPKNRKAQSKKQPQAPTEEVPPAAGWSEPSSAPASSPAEALRAAWSSCAGDDEFLMTSQETLKGALKLLKEVYHGIEVAGSSEVCLALGLDLVSFKGEAEAEAGGSCCQDVYASVEAMSACVVSALLGVPAAGVMQAVRSRLSSAPSDVSSFASFPPPPRGPSSNSSSSSSSSTGGGGGGRMQWCVSSSRTALSCCRLFDCLMSTFDAYTVEVSANNDSSVTSNCSNRGGSAGVLDEGSDFSFTDVADSPCIPWDLKMVIRHGVYLPRVCYEYSSLELPLERLESVFAGDSRGEAQERYVDKAYRGMFQTTLSCSHVYDKLRRVRALVFASLASRRSISRLALSDREDQQVTEVLRHGRGLLVAPAATCGENEGNNDRMLFFRQVLTEAPCMLASANCSRDTACGEAMFGGCACCRRVVSARSLQLKVLGRLLRVVFAGAGRAVEEAAHDCFTFQLSLVLLVARHMCDELVSLTCECYQSDALSESTWFRDVATDHSKCKGRTMTEFQLTNLWSTVEVCVLHCNYLMFSSHASQLERARPGTDEHKRATQEAGASFLQFPLASLSPDAFSAAHRTVLRQCKSARDFPTFMRRHFPPAGTGTGGAAKGAAGDAHATFLSCVYAAMS